MTEDDKALVKRLGAQKNNQLNEIEAMARIEQLTAEVERLQAKLAELNDSDIIAKTMAENERKDAEIARLRDALCDACDYIRGHIVGPAQRDGILREARALMES